MKSRILKKRIGRRIFTLGAIKSAAILCLMNRLYYLQIANNQQYRALSENNRINVSLINPIRGDILDCNNNKLAYNKEQYNLVFIPTEGINIEYTVERLLYIMRLSQSEYQNIYQLLSEAQEETTIQEDISWSLIKRVEFNLTNLHGILIASDNKRCYLEGGLCSHLIGYARRSYHSGLYSYIGKSGIEYSYNKILSGTPGVTQEEVNSKKRAVRQLSTIVSKPGQDIHLSINYKLQRFIHSILDHTGSVVVMNVKNGNVVAMNSYPSYDNNLFIKSITQQTWDKLTHDKDLPLLNRSVALQVPPGSVFKMISALVALRYGIINANTELVCNGHIKVGNRTFHCWKRSGHGKISLNEAIASSCNVFFYLIGQQITIDQLAEMASEFGLGDLSGIGLQEELSGIIPNFNWRKKHNKHWYTGDTVNSVIGHGYILATPIQLAVMTARLATGKKITPSLIKNDDDIDFPYMNIHSEDLHSVQYGMYNVVNSYTGTAYGKVHSLLHKRAGKTGTSQITSLDKSSTDHHSLFVGYAPYDQPKYALSVVIERSKVSGAASKIANSIFDYLYYNKL